MGEVGVSTAGLDRAFSVHDGGVVHSLLQPHLGGDVVGVSDGGAHCDVVCVLVVIFENAGADYVKSLEDEGHLLFEAFWHGEVVAVHAGHDVVLAVV